jgi:HlyD family secretion protein
MKTKRSVALLCALLLCAALPAAALAAVAYDGTVVSGGAVSVLAPFGGTVGTVYVQAGDEVNLGASLAKIVTTKVYAQTDGTVSGLFGQVGDSAEDVAARSGAVLYIAPANRYTVTADIQKAYNSSDNKYVNIGETVYVKSLYTARGNEAVGVVTAASGTAYTVETTQGELMMEETVVLFRTADYQTESRIGRGTVSRTAEVAVTGTGSIVYLHVKDGDAVTRGQLLFETVTGTLDGLYATGDIIMTDVAGIVAAVSVETGGTVSKGAAVATVYPRDTMQVLVAIDEYDLPDIREGDPVSIVFSYDEAGEQAVTGTVRLISHTSASTDTSDVTYNCYIDFPVNEKVRLGMTAVVTLAIQAEESDDTAEDAAAADEPVGDAQAQPGGNAGPSAP